MSRFRLHAASSFSLVVVCLLLLIFNIRKAPTYPFAWYGHLGYPVTFWDQGGFHFATLIVDVCFWVFSLFGTVAAIEIWCRSYHGPPKVSLLSLFGATAGFGFLFYHSTAFLHLDGRGSVFWFGMHIATTSGYLISIVFGVAVVGWIKLIGLAIERRKAAHH